MSNMPELDNLRLDVGRLKRIVQGDPEEGRKGLTRLVEELEAELERQSDERVEGTIAFRTRQLERRNEALDIRDRERKWILRSILGFLVFLTGGGGLVVNSILRTLQDLAARGTP
jgi:hypothetical protein